MGEFFTIPPLVVIVENNGAVHEAADGRGPACPEWEYPVTVMYRGVNLKAKDYRQLLELVRHLPAKWA